MAKLQPASHSESTIIELEEYRDAELPVDERGAELQDAYKVIEDQKRELEVQNRKLEEREHELEELRAFKSSRTGYGGGATGTVRECKA